MTKALMTGYFLTERFMVLKFGSVALENHVEKITATLLERHEGRSKEVIQRKITAERVGNAAKSLAKQNKFGEVQTLIDFCKINKLKCANIIVLRVHEAERLWRDKNYDEAMSVYSYLLLNLNQNYRRKVFNNLKFYFLHVLADGSDELHQRCTKFCTKIASSGCYRPLVVWWDFNFRSSKVMHNIEAATMCSEFKSAEFNRIIDSKLKSILQHCLVLASQNNYDAFHRLICCALQYDNMKWKSVSLSYFLLYLCSVLDLRRAREVWKTSRLLKIDVDPIAIYSYRKALEITKSPPIEEDFKVLRPTPQIKYDW